MKEVKFEWQGKTYVTQPVKDEERHCEGCAFDAAPAARNTDDAEARLLYRGCCESDKIRKCIHAPLIRWVEKPAEFPELNEAAERAFEVVAKTAESWKETNPKDMVGVRKAGLSYVPMNVVAEMGLGMLDGGCKYGRHNYRAAGVRASVYFDAAMRHLIAWWEGEDLDPDTAELDAAGQSVPGTGVHHVAKALTCLAVLRDAQLQGMCEDDRPPRSKPFYPELNRLAGVVIDRHAGKNPRHYTIADSKDSEAVK